jgi:hypothetical protein
VTLTVFGVTPAKLHVRVAFTFSAGCKKAWSDFASWTLTTKMPMAMSKRTNGVSCFLMPAPCPTRARPRNLQHGVAVVGADRADGADDVGRAGVLIPEAEATLVTRHAFVVGALPWAFGDHAARVADADV